MSYFFSYFYKFGKFSNLLIYSLESHNDVISVVIGVISIIVSVCGVYYGKQAYCVAGDIFKKGIQIDRQKVLQQISLEFVTGFFIPFSKFKIVTSPILGNSCGTQSMLYVRGLIEDNKFSVQFPYFDAHKGDVWDSLSICKDMEQSDAFNTIMDFVEKARKFDRAITDLNDCMNDFLKKKQVEKARNYDKTITKLNDCMNKYLKKKQREKESLYPTLKDFFDEYPSVNQDIFYKGMKMLEDLSEYENKLPKELEISKMKRRLFRD